MLRKVVVVFKTHFDLGFTGLPDEVMRAYTGPMFEAVRRTMDATANQPPNLRYCWTLPAWPLRFLLHDESVPRDTRAAARTLVEQGRLHWHAYPFTTHTAFCGLEELVRGLHVSRSLSEEFGRWPTGAKQTDVPGHTWILPTLLVDAGMKFLHLGCNSGSHAPHVPPFFWWEGPDGSRLLTYYSPGGYGTPLLPPDNWPYDTWLSLQQTVDNHGPHTPDELQRITRTIEQGAPQAEILFGQLGDFSDSLFEHPEQLADLPVVSYDLADTWIHGVGTMPSEVVRVRDLRAKLLLLEQQAAIYDWPIGKADTQSADFPTARRIAPLVDAAYEQLLLFGEHTWGLDVKSTIKRTYGEEFKRSRSTEPYRRLEESWVAKAAYVGRAEAHYDQAQSLLQAEMAAKPRLFPFGDYILEQDKRFTSLLSQSSEVTADNVLEDRTLRLEVDPTTGGIVSLLDKQSGHEWVDSSSAEPFGGYRYDLYSAGDIAEFMRAYGRYFQDWFVQDFGKQGYPEDSRHITAYARQFKLEKGRDERGSYIRLFDGTLVTEGGAKESLPSQTVSMTVRFGASTGRGHIELEYFVSGKEATQLAESTVVPFPFNLRRPFYRLGQTGSMIDPARDIAEGANRYLWCANWLYASDDREGIGVYGLDVPLFSIGDPGIYRFSMDRVPAGNTTYAHLSNTQWGTNFPQWLEGEFRWRVRLLPKRVGVQWDDLKHHTNRARDLDPLIQHRWETLLNIRGSSESLLSVKPKHDGDGLIIRLHEASGRHTRTWLAPLAAMKSMWRCDLMERPVEKIEFEQEPSALGGTLDIPLDLAPHSVETIWIEFK